MLDILRTAYPSLTSAQQRVDGCALKHPDKALWLTGRRGMQYTRYLISPENLARIKELEQMIISGDLEATDIM